MSKKEIFTPSNIGDVTAKNRIIRSATNDHLGTWLGIYLCEFRDYGGERTIVLTVYC